jgi:hypothetical protein
VGIATLNGHLFLVRNGATEVEVYDSAKFTLMRRVSVLGMTNPRCLAACQRYNCLYTSDFAVKIVHRVDLSNDVVTKWQLEESAYSLSVTRNYNLLVTLLFSKKLQEYTTQGRLVREINLEVSIEGPSNSIELSSGHFVVSHLGSRQHRVCIVNMAGRIIYSYGDEPGSVTEQLSGPLGLAVDTHGNVLVAEYHNNRVKLLSPTLTHLAEVSLPAGHQLHKPGVLHLDELNGRLYIGERFGLLMLSASCSNLIFDISSN